MPFPALVGLGFTQQEDSSYFKDSYLDGTIKYEVTGGLVVARRRFTRQPNRSIETGFSNMSQANKEIIDAYYSIVMQAGTFTYTHPTSAESLTVRFDDVLKPEYMGAGTTFVWKMPSIKLRTI
jgi:hypothetical protein